MVSATDEAAFEIEIDKFCGHTVSKRQLLRSGGFNDGAPPLPMLFVHVLRRGQLIRRGKVSFKAGCFKDRPALFHLKPAAFDRRRPAGSPSRKKVTMTFDPVGCCTGGGGKAGFTFFGH